MSTLIFPPLPRAIVDQIAKALPFDELWRVRSVNSWWNKIALQRARSELYKGSTVNAFIFSHAKDTSAVPRNPSRYLWGIGSMVELTPQETPRELETEVLIWGKKWSQPLRVPPSVTNANALRIDFTMRGVSIRFPLIPPKKIFPIPYLELNYPSPFSPIQTPDPMVVEWVLQKGEQESENCRIADWTIYSKGFGCIDGQQALELCMELPLWQFVALFLKWSPFAGGHTIVLRCRSY